MITTTEMPPSTLDPLPTKVSTNLLEMPTKPAAETKPAEDTRSYRGDWVALVFWLACFVLMGVILLCDLVVGLFR